MERTEKPKDSDTLVKWLSLILGVLIAIGSVVRWYTDRKPLPRTVLYLPSMFAQPADSTPKPEAPIHKHKVTASAPASSAIGEQKIKGDCNATNNGGVGNTVTANCLPQERHLTQVEKGTLEGIAIPSTVKVTIEETTEEDSERYGTEIANALNLPSSSRATALYNGSAPQDVTVQAHAQQESQDVINVGLGLSKALNAHIWINERVPSGEIKIVVGRKPRSQ